MARVLITGSSDGLGLMAARLLVDDGHAVTLHARKEQRGDDTRPALPGVEHVVIGDVQSIAGMCQVAEQANVWAAMTQLSTTSVWATANPAGSRPPTGSVMSSRSMCSPRTC